MDPRVFFDEVVKPNYEDAKRATGNFRFVWNAILSLNTVPEYLAIHRLDYEEVDRTTLDNEGNRIRNEFPSLRRLKKCANALKHVRSMPKNPKRSNVLPEITSTSTGILPSDTTTWTIDICARTYELPTILDEAFDTIKAFPEFARK